MGKIIFGIYPGGSTASAASVLRARTPDEPERIRESLDELQGEAENFLIRCYTHYTGSAGSDHMYPDEPEYYLERGRKMDLVICYRSPEYKAESWDFFVREQVRHYGGKLSKVQIAEEPNLKGVAAADGDSPDVFHAVRSGVIAAKEEILRSGFPITVGFNSVPSFDPANQFWTSMNAMKDPDFLRALDYVGLNFFPGAFRPVTYELMEETISMVIGHFRNQTLRAAGISNSIPLHITENGMPVMEFCDEEEQSRRLAKIIRCIHGLSQLYHIEAYELFCLRDADSAAPDLFGRFGILYDDYRQKPSFRTYRNCILELS